MKPENIAQVLPFHFSFVKAEKLQIIQAYFGSLAEALAASQADWLATNLLSEKQLARLFDKNLPNLVDLALDWGKQDHQTIIVNSSEHYPKLLKEIPDPPILLYVRGKVELLSDPQIAIVGSRNSSRLGLETARDFASYLSSVGLTIISGMASGIDTAAHEGGLIGQGKTVAVVGTGLDRVYPASNRNLARQIATAGVMISEYALGTKPKPYHFPQRNRIIAGLSVGVLVVEAALKSGSLITAKMAMEQGREVFAVPGAINNPHAKGCHQLIRSGAKLVGSGEDILEEIASIVEFTLTKNLEITPSVGQNVAIKGIMQHIEYEPIGLDELAVLSKLPVSDIQSQLMILVLEGKLEALSAARWRRLN